jgi:hypothetical protein
MCRCLGIVFLLALIAQGCTKKPEDIPLAALRFDYQTWNCRQLAEESDLLRDALAVASEQRAIDTVAHLKTATEEVHKASTLKKCKA